MRLSKVLALLLVSTVTLANVVPASAEIWPHAREGFVLGGGIGGGSAEGRLDGGTGSAILSTERGGGAGAHFRIGYAVSPQLVFGLESSGWLREEKASLLGTDATFRTTLNVTALALTWYPGEGGFFARGGLGVGTVRQKIDVGSLNGEIAESGVGLLMAFGYEWRLARSLALGPRFDLGWMNLGEFEIDDGQGGTTNADVKFDFANFTLAMNWYFGS